MLDAFVFVFTQWISIEQIGIIIDKIECQIIINYVYECKLEEWYYSSV